MISPLRKRKQDGALYERFPDIQQKLQELDLLESSDLIAHCRISKGDEGHVPSECVLHFVRREWASQNMTACTPLLEVLLERVRRRLPRGISADGLTVSLARSDAAEQVYDKFVGMLLGEVEAYDQRLDFFEVAFAEGLAKLSCTAKSRADHSASRRADVVDEEGGEVEAEVEVAVGIYDPFTPENLDQSLYRSRLAGAMSKLKPMEKRIVEMLRLEMPISSKDPTIVTIASTLGRSEKGIRLIRDQAFARLRRMLERGDTP